jgi:hypothetical protein
MLTILKNRILWVCSALVSFGAAAVVLSDADSDEQAKRVIPLYGSYTTDALMAPDRIVCVLRQLWKPEFLGQGDVHVEVNEKQCFGTGEGDESISAVVNLSVDNQTGNTVAKIWYDDQNSVAYDGEDIVVYIKATVSASPTATEPYGQFILDVVEELKETQEVLSIINISSNGNAFKLAVTSNNVGLISSAGTFSVYVNSLTQQAIYSDGINTTVVGFDDQNICYQLQSSPPTSADCFLRVDPNAVNFYGSYGIYNTSGSRLYPGSNALVRVGGIDYYMSQGFGGSLLDSSNNSPGEVSSSSNSILIENMVETPVKIQWLAKAVLNTSVGQQGNISMNADTSLLPDPSKLTDIRSYVGTLPVESFSLPVRAKSGKIL